MQLTEGRTGTLPDGTRVVVRNGQVVPVDGGAGGFRQVIPDQTGPQRDPPSGYEWNPDGTMAPIPGGPADDSGDGGPSGVDQARIAGFALGAQRSNTAFNALGVEPPSLGRVAAQSVLGEDIVNQFTGARRQTSEAIERDFVANTLRFESGAAIPPSEMDSQRRRYFPRPGDSEETLAAKRQLRQNAIDSLLIGAGGENNVPGFNDQVGPQSNTEAQPGNGLGSAAVDATQREVARSQALAGLGRNAGQENILVDANAGGSSELLSQVDEMLRDGESTTSEIMAFIEAQGASVPPETARAIQYYVDNRDVTPQNATFDRDEEVRASRAGQFMRGAADTATLGTTDEIAAAVSGRDINDVRAGFDTMAEQQPGANLAGQVAGGFVLPVGRVNSVARAAGAGGGYGFGYGMGSSDEDTIARRIPDAAIMGTVGAATGGVLQRYAPAVGDAVGSALGRAANSPAGQGVRSALSAIEQRAPGAARRATQRENASVGQTLSRDAALASGRQDVPLYRPDVDDSVRNRFSSEEAGLAGGRIREDLATTDAGIQRRIGEIAPGEQLDDVGLGQTVQDGAERFIDRSRGIAGSLYERAERASRNVDVDPSNTLARIDDEILDLSRSPNVNQSEINFLTGLRDDIAGGSSVEAFRNLRTNLRTTLKQNNLTSTPAEARVMAIMDDLSGDIQSAVQAQGNPGAQRLWDRADTFYRDRQQAINGVFRQVLGPRGDRAASPEAVARRIRSMTRSDSGRVSEVMRRLSPEERANVSATIGGELGRNRKGDWSVAQFVNQVEQMKEPARVALFGRDGADAIQDLQTIAKARDRTLSAVNRSNSGRSVINYRSALLQVMVGGGGGYAAGGGVGAVAGAVVAGKAAQIFERLSANRRASLLMDPEFVRALRDAPATNSGAAINAHFARLNRIMAANDNALETLSNRLAAEGSDDGGGAVPADNER